MAFDREAAKQAGYSDDEINAYMQAEAEKNKTEAPAPVVADVGEPPAPTTTIKPVESSAASVTTTAGIGLAPYVVPAAGVAAAALGGGKLYSGWREGVEAAREMARVSAQNASTHAATQEMKTLQQIARGTGPEAQAAQQRLLQLIQGRGGAPIPTAPTAPVVPQGPVSTGPVAPPAGTAPVAQGAQMAEQAAARAPSLLDKTTNMVRQLAASKVFNTLAKGATGLQLATYSPELGPQTPQVGRMRGMEINPMTGRPWTKEQLQAYSANPQMFDSQLPPAQMPR